MGYKIKEKRTAIKMSQEELAQKSGVSRKTISDLETGAAKNTTTRTIVSIAKALGTTVSEIFQPDEE